MALPELLANSPIPGQDAPLTSVSGNGGSISAIATTMNVAGAAPAPLQGPGQFRIIWGDGTGEIALVTAGASGTAWTMTRGVEGSTAAIHADGARIYHRPTAGALDARYPHVGTDGTVGGPGGTGLASSVVSGAQRATRLASFGHSFAADVGSTNATQGWTHKLARALGAEHVHYGHSGAAAALDDSTINTPSAPGGFNTVINGLRPQVALGTNRTAAPYMAAADVVAFDFGDNDLWADHTNPASTAVMVRNAMRAMICRARAGGLFEDNDASVAYTGTWTAQTIFTTTCSGANAHSSSTPSDHLTITVPADFPGGEIDLGFMYGNSNSVVWSVTVDGGAAQLLDLTAEPQPTASGKLTHGVLRLTGLSAGAHTIVATISSVAAGSGFFDYWEIAAQQLPTVVVVNQTHHDIAGGWVTSGTTGFQHSPVTNADIDLVNTQLAALVAEFDGYVVLADAAFAFGSSPVATGSPLSPLNTDNFHPNDYGHTLIAQSVLSALRGASYNPGCVPGRPYWRMVNAAGYSGAYPSGADPALQSGWSAFGAGWGSPTGAKFCKDASGQVNIRLALKSAAQPPGTTTIFNLPEGYWPADNIELPIVANSGASDGSVFIGSGGNVVWIAGTSTNAILADLSYMCDE